MNTPSHTLLPIRQAARSERGRKQRGFTLAETLVTGGVFALIMGTVLSLYVFSARSTSGVCQQLTYGNQARVLSLMANEIRSAISVAIQNYNGTNFTTIAAGQIQQGNALSLTISNATSNYQTLYWLNSTGSLYRAVMYSANSRVYLNNVTNTLPFSLQDYQGNIVSNQTQRTLVNINLRLSDPNPKNFIQTMTLLSSVENRN